MKYLLIVFAMLVLSLWWLSNRYHLKLEKMEAAKSSHSQPHKPAKKPTDEIVPPAQKTPATDKVAGGTPLSAAAKQIPASSEPQAAPQPAPQPALPHTTAANASPATGEITAASEAPKPTKDWPKLCYNASMLAERAVRRHHDGATLPELIEIGNGADVDFRDTLQGIISQVNDSPRSSDFAQQQLMMDTVKSNAYNTCMNNHR